MKKIIFLLVVNLFSAKVIAQNNYTMDKNHSRLSFNAIHSGISHVEGNFKKFEATVVASKEDFTDAKIELKVDVNSINTEVDMRDEDLRDNWFETKKYPEITFKSTSFTKLNGNKYKLKGDITIKEVTKPMEFDVLYNGKALNQRTKKYSYGFTIDGKLKRVDFNVGGTPEKTGVSDEIILKSNIEFILN